MSLVYTIQLAESKDVPEIAALHAESWRAAYRGLVPEAFLGPALDDERLRAWRDRFAQPHPDRRVVFTAVSNDRGLLGFSCVLADADPQHGPLLDNLHVKPAMRGAGIGQRLLRMSREWARTIAPGKPMHLWVIEANTPARAFYSAQGGCEGERRQQDMAGTQVVAIRVTWI